MVLESNDAKILSTSIRTVRLDFLQKADVPRLHSNQSHVGFGGLLALAQEAYT